MSLTSGIRVEWTAALPIAAMGYLVYERFYVEGHCNQYVGKPSHSERQPKITHAFDMEDLGDTAVYCNCWRSKKFPLRDGAHTEHNKESGDNVGPLIIERTETEEGNSFDAANQLVRMIESQ